MLAKLAYLCYPVNGYVKIGDYIKSHINKALKGNASYNEKSLKSFKKLVETKDTWAASLTFLLLYFDEETPKWKEKDFYSVDELTLYLKEITNEKIHQWAKYEPGTSDEREFNSQSDQQLVKTLVKGLEVDAAKRPTAEEMALLVKPFLKAPNEKK